MNLGGCQCCNPCQRCTSGATVQATIAVTNRGEGCNSTPGCAEMDGTYVLEFTADATLPADIITAAEDSTGCHWSAPLPEIACSTDDCDDCDCDYNFSDEGGTYPDGTCDGLCEADPVKADPVGTFGDGNYEAVNNPSCGDCAIDGCETSCGAEQELNACSCISDGVGGYTCSCDADCGCTTSCIPEIGYISVYLYRKDTSLEAVLYVEVLLPNGRYLHGEFVGGATTIDCLSEFNPKTVTLTQFGASGPQFCTDPASIDVEFL